MAFIDNNIQNVKIDGLECISIDEAIRRGAQNEMVLVSLKESDDVEKQLKEKGFNWIFCMSEWMYKKEYFTPKTSQKSDYCKARPFNHYESPYSDIIKVHENENKLFNMNKEILDIDFNLDRQFELLEKMKGFDLPQWTNLEGNKGYRYYYNNHWFGKGSADALYYMIRIVKPKRIIEVGSGFSTAIMLDTNEQYFGNSIKIISIEPRADRLKSILRPTDNIEIYEKDFQEMAISFFESLEENDILFIDSSHVAKINSDVNFLFFEILPRLKKAFIFISMICFIHLYIPKNGSMKGTHIMRCIF